MKVPERKNVPCYLIENKEGFESPLFAGTREELEEKKKSLDYTRKTMSHAMPPDKAWKSVSYYIVPKREWEVEHCPLMPVDYA